ncbi:MAG: hypothetical protein ACKPKO_61715 [Candidatus Fonsibacter sp.]
MMSNDERLHWWSDHPSTDVADIYMLAIMCAPLGVVSNLRIEELVILTAHLLVEQSYDTLDDCDIEDADNLISGTEPLSVDPWDSW